MPISSSWSRCFAWGLFCAIAVAAPAESVNAERPKLLLLDPSDSTDGSTAGQGDDLVTSLSLQATKETEKIKARVAKNWVQWMASVSIEGPISKGSKEAELASLDGLANDTQLKASATWMSFEPKGNAAAIVRVCAEHSRRTYECSADSLRTEAKALFADKTEGDKKKLEEQQKERRVAYAALLAHKTKKEALCVVARDHAACGGKGDNEQQAPEILEASAEVALLLPQISQAGAKLAEIDDKIKEIEERIEKELEAACEFDRNKLRAIYETKPITKKPTPAEVKFLDEFPTCSRNNIKDDVILLEQFDGYVDWGSSFAFTVYGRGSRNTFKFAEPDDFETEKQSKTSFVGGARFTVLVEDVLSASFGVEGQVRYKGAKASELCRPVGTAGFLECESIATKPPTKTTSTIARFEIRRIFSKHFGMALKANYDVSEQVVGFELPLYFLQSTDPKGGLAGGVSFEMRSDDLEPSVALFVGDTFKLADGS